MTPQLVQKILKNNTILQQVKVKKQEAVTTVLNSMCE